MPETSSSAVQTATTRPPVKADQTESISERMERIYNAISRRAYELFERDGGVHGRDTDHWLQAENELLVPVQFTLDETNAEFVVRGEVPGFTANDLEVNVEPRRVTISGKRETKREGKEGDVPFTESSSEMFQSMALPSDANPAKVSATLKDSVLEIKIPKAETTRRSIPLNSQSDKQADKPSDTQSTAQSA